MKYTIPLQADATLAREKRTLKKKLKNKQKHH